jgi:hypothetical protein
MDCLDKKKDEGMREVHLRNRESSERVQREKVSYNILCMRNREYLIIFFLFFFFNGGQLQE